MKQYISETGLIMQQGRPPEYTYFRVWDTFISNCINQLPQSVVIAAACSTMEDTTMAEAFTSIGGAAYIGLPHGVRSPKAVTMNSIWNL